jgi:hypothetical protein
VDDVLLVDAILRYTEWRIPVSSRLGDWVARLGAVEAVIGFFLDCHLQQTCPEQLDKMTQ